MRTEKAIGQRLPPDTVGQGGGEGYEDHEYHEAHGVRPSSA